MAKQDLYSVWNLPNESLKKGYTAAYCVTKHDRITFIENNNHYVVKLYSRNDWYKCDCPGFINRKKCRHQTIVEEFIKKRKVGTGSLFDYDNSRWSNHFVCVPEEK